MIRERRVVKLGGSLLIRSGLPDQLTTWLSANDDMQNIIVVGGGELADAIRRLQPRLKLDNSDCHRLACRAMSVNAEAIARSNLSFSLADQFECLESHDASVIVFDTLNWLSQSADVAKSWDFTSDSIAAKLAVEIRASELVLLKSRIGSLSEPGFVDTCFAKESESINSIRICTLAP